jgi:hypothetical protein
LTICFATGRRSRMIRIALGQVTAYRMHTSKWSSAPTSGAGAAKHGGRANRPGTPALYLALETETAVREYQQLSSLMPQARRSATRFVLRPSSTSARATTPNIGPRCMGGVLVRLAGALVQSSDRASNLVSGGRGDRRRRQGHLVRVDVRASGVSPVLYPKLLSADDVLSVHGPAG